MISRLHSLISRRLRVAAVAALCGVLAACASDPGIHADTLAAQGRLQHEQIKAGRFVLTAYTRISKPGQLLTIYIEGDGLAWRGRGRPSDDPTPRKAVGLQLAAADTGANVAYVARPCQYTPMSANAACTPEYWTGKRYAPEVVDAMNVAVSRLKARAPGSRLRLVGYSGGGAIAVLLAARRADVAEVRTVAGNLGVEEVNRIHGVTPMPESLDPYDVASRLVRIPQLHLSGADDSVVPTAVARRFAAAAGPCARVQVQPGLSHEGDWAAIWPAALAQPAGCR